MKINLKNLTSVHNIFPEKSHLKFPSNLIKEEGGSPNFFTLPQNWINTSYWMVPSAIWQTFYKFHIFYKLFVNKSNVRETDEISANIAVG